MNKKWIWILCSFSFLLLVLFINFDLFPFSKSKHEFYQNFIVPKEAFEKGETLMIQNTTIMSFDLGTASDQFIRHEEFEFFEGLHAREAIAANQPILKSQVASFRTARENIPAGKRLFVLDMPVGPLVSILKVGDFVDILAQIDMPELGNVTETILEAARIISIGNRSQENSMSDGDNSFLSFYLTPDEVKIISFMKPYSNFSVVLRNPSDNVQQRAHPITFNHFLENEKIKKIVESNSFRIINGRTFK